MVLLELEVLCEHAHSLKKYILYNSSLRCSPSFRIQVCGTPQRCSPPSGARGMTSSVVIKLSLDRQLYGIFESRSSVRSAKLGPIQTKVETLGIPRCGSRDY